MKYIINTDTRIFYINLDDNKERRLHIDTTLKRLNFTNITRISAIDTRTIKKIDGYKSLLDNNAYLLLLRNIKENKRHNHRDLTKGSIGCYLSHLKVYNRMLEENIPYAIIFEDDCNIIDPNIIFWEKMKMISDKIPDNVDIFLFDAIIHEYRDNCSKYICQVNFFWGSHFYLITQKGINNILKYLLPIQYQIDNALSIMSYSNKLNIFGCRNIIFCDNIKFKSTIQLLDCINCDIKKEIEYIKKKADNQESINPDLIEYFNQITTTKGFNISIILIIIFIIIILVITKLINR